MSAITDEDLVDIPIVVAEDFEVTILDVLDAPQLIEANGRDKYTNKSYSVASSNEIILGLYDDPELKLISLFHELGHILAVFEPEDFYEEYSKAHQYRELPNELRATALGLEIAFVMYDIAFSDKALKWMYEQAFTYCRKDKT